MTGVPKAPGQDAVIALNTAFMTDGAIVSVGQGAALDKPVLLVFARAAREGRLVTTRNVIEVGEGARATVIEATSPSPARLTARPTRSARSRWRRRRARSRQVRSRARPRRTSRPGWRRSGAEAAYRAFQLTAATGLARNDLLATFQGEGGKLDISGSFLGRGREHIDTTLVVDHAVPGCESRELFKGVLADRARGVFQGKVIVRPDAQKTDGKQMAQVLMLSQDAEFDSKPELEIHADDVVCGHGSTAAEIDADLLFYMRSRGIPPGEARALLIESFIGEAIDKIEDERLREALAAHRQAAAGQALGDMSLNAARAAAENAHDGDDEGDRHRGGPRLRRREPYAPTSRSCSRQVYGKPLVYLDNGASAQKPRAVLEAMDHAYRMRIRQRASRAALPLQRRHRQVRGGARDRAPLPQCTERRGDHLHAQPDRRRSTSSPAPSAWTSRQATRSSSRSWSTTPTSCPGISIASARAAC